MPPDTTVTLAADVEQEPSVASWDDAPQQQHVRRGGGVFVVDFHRDGNSALYRTFGWSGQEQTHVWSVQGSSGLRLPAPIEYTALVVELDFTICHGRERPSAAVVRVFANGHLVGAVRAAGWTRLQCDIPADLIAPNQPIDLRIEHPCFVRMDFMDMGGDDRALGLCFYAVRLFPPWLKQMADHGASKPADGKLVQAVMPLPTAMGPASEPAVYRFGAADPGRIWLHEGWLDDRNGNTWADARLCTLELPAPALAGRYIARFALCPLYIRDFMTFQRINILLAGAVIGQFQIGTDTTLAIPLPPELYDPAGVLRFSFAMPGGVPMHQFHPGQPPNFLSFLLDQIDIEAIAPRHAALVGVRDDDVALPAPVAVSDRFLDESIIELPDAVKAALGIEMTEILRHFESLGDNCAFGLAQRKGGCEVLGLLRFANTPLQSLLVALDDEFRAASSKTDIALRLQDGPAGEYTLSVDRYNIRWHTDVLAGEVDEATVFAQQTMRLAYLRRKFYEGLGAGRKILTISRAEPRKHPIPMPYADEPDVREEDPERLRFAEVLPLFLKLNQYGSNSLLYLTRCAHDRRSGMVELVAPGVMRGYVDDFVIVPDMNQKDHVAWLRIAVNAWLLEQGPNAAFRSKAVS